MFLCALQTSAVIAIIAVIAVQYAFALFCLLKLAYLDITKKEYVLWNLFILIVFFIGGIAFLIYYFKVKDKKAIKPVTDQKPEEIADAENAETNEPAAAEAQESENAPDSQGDNADDK